MHRRYQKFALNLLYPLPSLSIECVYSCYTVVCESFICKYFVFLKFDILLYFRGSPQP